MIKEHESLKERFTNSPHERRENPFRARAVNSLNVVFCCWSGAKGLIDSRLPSLNHGALLLLCTRPTPCSRVRDGSSRNDELRMDQHTIYKRGDSGIRQHQKQPPSGMELTERVVFG